MPASARGSTLLPVLALFALSLWLGLWRLAEAPIIVDERVWMREGYRSFDLFSAGAFDDPYWSGYRATYGYPSAPFSKLLIGASLAAHGVEPTVGATPGPELLRAGRLPSVLLGAIGVAALFGSVRPFLGGRVAFAAALLLLASPGWLMASRRAMVDVQSVALWLVALGSSCGRATRRWPDRHAARWPASRPPAPCWGCRWARASAEPDPPSGWGCC